MEGTFGILSIVFSAGLLSFFSPCTVPLLPVYAGSLIAAGDTGGLLSLKANLARALAFVAGLSAPFFLLGLGAGALGQVFSGAPFMLVCGILVILYGLHQAGVITIPLTRRTCPRAVPRLKTGLAGTCALGFLFSFGWTPCTGPLLAALLGLSARQGNALDGGTLLLVYSLGLGLPFLLIALASQQILQRIRRISRFFPTLQKMGGLLFVIMGGWMLYTQAERVFLAW